jgi:hypothetical protein
MATPTTTSRWWTDTTFPLQSFYSHLRMSLLTTFRPTSPIHHVKEQTGCLRNKTTTHIQSTLTSFEPTARILCRSTRKWIRNRFLNGVLGIYNSLPQTSLATACIRIPTTTSNDPNSILVIRHAQRIINPKIAAPENTTRLVNVNPATTRKTSRQFVRTLTASVRSVLHPHTSLANILDHSVRRSNIHLHYPIWCWF